MIFNIFGCKKPIKMAIKLHT